MSDVVYARWLGPRDARAVARLERKAYARDRRNGRRAIAHELATADRAGENLSMGVFDGGRLVGFILAYLRRDRAAVFDDFEVHHEEARALRGASVYVEDVIAIPRYSRCLFRLFRRWSRTLRDLAPGLPMDAFCEPALLERWTRYARGFRHSGLELDRTLKVTDLSYGQEWYWLSWRALGGPAGGGDDDAPPGTALRVDGLPSDCQVRVIRTETDWERLRRDWDRLLEAQPVASPFASLDYLQAWWRHYGLSRRLSVVTLYRRGRLAGIAPMMIAPKRILGRFRWRLEFIGDRVNMERPGTLTDPARPGTEALLWRAVLATAPEWDAVYLREQPTGTGEHPVVTALDGGRYTVSLSEPMESPHVDLQQPWADYLAGRSRSLRKGYRRRLRQLGKEGELACVDETHFGGAEESLEAYLAVEEGSWKARTPYRVAGNPVRFRFYRDLVRTLGRRGEIRFRFLLLDGRPIAATFGVVRHRRYASLEICHDGRYDDYSPGFVLTGLELEALMADGSCDEYDFLIGTFANKSSWATHAVTARHVYVLPRNLWGHANRLLIFRMKAALLGLLSRLGFEDRAFDLYDRIRNRLG